MGVQQAFVPLLLVFITLLPTQHASASSAPGGTGSGSGTFPSTSTATALEKQKRELIDKARREGDRVASSARATVSSVASAATAEFEVQRKKLIDVARAELEYQKKALTAEFELQKEKLIEVARVELENQKISLAAKAKEAIDEQKTRATGLVSGVADSATEAVNRIGQGGPSYSSGRGESAMVTSDKKSAALPDSVKLLIGAGGIYAAFIYYGSLQEDVFRYTADDGSSFKQAWFLQVLEAAANVLVGFIGMQLSGPTKGIPLKMFGISGAAQVSAKACTSLALANGLSFPVATLAKSGKMAPVMAGSLLLGGASYSLREYVQVASIIGGTAIVSMGKKKGSGTSSTLGVTFIVLSLVLDGVTAGFQKRLKTETLKAGVKPKPYDFMFWTNLFMALTALLVAGVLGEVYSGIAFCMANNEIFSKIIKFAVCSAVGQSFIFYTIANFDPLVLSTVTTTRKVFSVLLSIFLKGHSLSLMGWSGIMLACSGIMSELLSKTGGKAKAKSQ